MSLDEFKTFKEVSDIATYVKNGLVTGKISLDEVAKFARIHARQGELGEEVITKMANGLEETRNTVKQDEKTGEPGWIVTNPDGEEYIVEDSVFKERYEIDPENPEQYKPKGRPVLSAKINEHVQFQAPWGETMKIEAGGSLILSGPSNIYGIQKDEFDHTYASTGKDRTECLKDALEMFGITKEQYIEARQNYESQMAERHSSGHSSDKDISDSREI